MPYEKRIEIRWRDMDAYRHVNNAVFLTYLEEVRDELLGGALDDAYEDFVLARVALDYLRPLRQDDEVVVARCAIARLGRSSVQTREELQTAGGEVAARAASVMVAVDTGTGSARRLTDAERGALEPLLEP